MKSDQIREEFLHFFEEKGHRVIPSSSLVPEGDPTLLLTTAGMVQFKRYFTGEAIPPHPRLASCQKCFRTTDIDAVGDAKHLTFFEMLGNFSVGDYFKREAIAWAWEFVTERLGLPPERLWVTIFLDDDEAFDYWREIGVPQERIIRFSEEDNFWGPAGDTGPCGPCSEIHYDVGPEFGCGRPDCGPNCDCGRFIEVWNLVFTQYDQQPDGRRLPLPRPNIDTGMGLERIAAAMQGQATVYETDLFSPLIDCVADLSGKWYGEDADIDRAMRIVAEHGRAITFLIADGVMPSNEGRGYVLRRVLRRAALFGRKLGLEGQFLGEIAQVVIAQMGHIYPELERGQEVILSTIEAEEGRFDQTLDRGLGIFRGLINYRTRYRGVIPELVSFAKEHVPSAENASAILERYGFGGYDKEAEPFEQIGEQMAAESITDLLYHALKSQEEGAFAEAEDKFSSLQEWSNCLSGHEVFTLYDTYGLPIDTLHELVEQGKLYFDSDGFEKELLQQRERARAAAKVDITARVTVHHHQPTLFVGYDEVKHKSSVLSLSIGGKPVDTVGQGQDVEVVLSETPFYGEMGGQVGDTGEIHGPHGRIRVTNAIWPSPEVIVHQGKVVEGQISVGDTVEVIVDQKRRLDIARNHTATHLLQAALRQLLGEQVRQSGSLVAPDRFRFDFTHPSAPTKEQLAEVQRIVNEYIRRNLKVSSRMMPYREALHKGALAFFGEKYGDEVRVLEIGEPTISMELCGGTHVKATGEIGFFQIVSESSIGAGLRRIEAVTGRGAEEFIAEQLSIMAEAAHALKGAAPEILDRVSALQQELESERKRASALERELLKKTVDSIVGQVESVKGIPVLAVGVSASNTEALRQMGDLIKERLKSVLVVLGAIYNEQVNFVAMVTPDLVKRGLHAGEIVKQVAAVAGGSGGGRAEMGQAGGKDKKKLDEALKLVKELVAKHGDAGT